MVERDTRPKERKERKERKDRLIQTRVPSDLEATLKEEARRRRLSVSHLIRNILEDSLDLVGDSVQLVGDSVQLVSDSVERARSVGRRLADSGRGTEPMGDLSQVYAWNEVVLNHDVTCSQCGASIDRGARGYTGLSDAPQRPKAWLCERCVGQL